MTLKPLMSSFLLKKKMFKIAIVVEPPFVMKKTGNYTGNDLWEGYCIDMLKHFSKNLDFNYILHESYDGLYGGKNADTQEWNGIVKELQTGQADLAVAAFTINSLRQEVIDFTLPFLDFGLTVIIKKTTPGKGLWDFMDPFTSIIWILLFCSTICVGFVLTVCSTLSPFGYYGERAQVNENLLDDQKVKDLEEEKNNMRLDEATWFSLGSLLGQGTDHQPKSLSGKTVAVMWWMAGTIFVVTYTANLAAFVTVGKFPININSVEELAAQDKISYGTVKSSHPSQFFERSSIPLYQTMWATMSTEETLVDSSDEALQKVNNKNYAFIWDSVVLEYVANQEPCGTYVLNDMISSLSYGIGLPLHSPYKHMFSTEILKLRENGFFAILESKWFVKKGKCLATNTKTELKAVKLSHVMGVFWLVLGGIVLGFIVLVGEWFYFTHKLVNKENTKYPTYKEALKARLSIVWEDVKFRWIFTNVVAKSDSQNTKL